jgi:hypothetical protein
MNWLIAIEHRRLMRRNGRQVADWINGGYRRVVG